MKEKKFVLLMMAVLSLFLTACAGNGNKAEDMAAEKQESEIQGAEDTSAEAEKQETEEEAEPAYYLIDNPSQEYYLTKAIVAEEEITLSLEMLSEAENQITDTEVWFAENELTKPQANSMEDEHYRYVLEGENGFNTYMLHLYEKESGTYLGCLDFSKYRYTDNIKAGDEDFVEQRIWWAQSVDSVLYVAISHYTYTESCPHTGYLVAIDLNDMSVIWKSEPCVTNVQTFEIIDNTIVCGYGFTSEPDYLILVNRLDGSVTEKIPIRSKADYIIRKDDVLYVRTYNTNYTFQISQEISCR